MLHDVIRSREPTKGREKSDLKHLFRIRRKVQVPVKSTAGLLGGRVLFPTKYIR